MKKIVLVFVFAVLFSGIVFGQTITKEYNSTDKKVTMRLSQGWDLVPSGTDTQTSSPSSNPLAAFFWNPLDKKYYGGGYGSTEGNNIATKLNELRSAGYATATMGATWVYMPKSEEVTVTYGGAALTSNTGKKIAKGWNFISLMPWMIGKKISGLFDNCSITKANAWFGIQNEWASNNSTEYWNTLRTSNETVKEGSVGYTIVVYSESECGLSSVEMQPPPVLPD